MALLALLLFTFAASGAALAQTQTPNASDDWAMFRQNPQRNGTTQSAAPNGNLLWRFYTDLPYNSSSSPSADRLRSSPSVAGGILYFGGNNTYFYALNATNGALITADQLQTKCPSKYKAQASPAAQQ